MGQTIGVNASVSNLKQLGKRVIASTISLGVLFSCLVFTSTASAAEKKAPIVVPSDQVPIPFQPQYFFMNNIAFSRPPGDLPGQTAMTHVYPVCNGANNFDCIMNVEFINKDGKRVSGKFLEYIPVAPHIGYFDGRQVPPFWYPSTQEMIVKGNAKKKIPDGSRSSIWSFPGLSHSSGDKYLVSVATGAEVTNQKAPNADGSVANWQDAGLGLSITPIKVDNDTSGLESTTQSADGKLFNFSSVDTFAKFGSAGNADKVCFVSFESGKPNCFSQAEDSEFSRFKISLRLKFTEDSLAFRNWFVARASGINITSKKESESSIVSFEGTTISFPKVTALLPRTNEGFKVYQDAMIKSYAAWGVVINPTDITDVLGIVSWQNMLSVGAPSEGAGAFAFWSGIEPFAKFLVEPRSPTWSFGTAIINGSEFGWLMPCVRKPHVSGAVSSNATITMPSPPIWNAEKQTLDFRVASPHLNQDGSVAQGFYNLSVSQEVANCLWGGDVSKSKAEVSIISEAGEKKISVSATSSSDGYLNFQVSGFTYSVNTISLKLLKTVTTAPTKNPTPPKEITCKKGKIIKKFKALKCPAGYIKK